jgi:cytochrome c nitrite reductase small subunit
LSGGREKRRRKLLNLKSIQGIALGISLGTAIGIGAYTFIYAKGYSYLSNDPGACANCHVMQEHYG